MSCQVESPVSQELSEMRENDASAAQQGWAGEGRTLEEGGSSRWAMESSLGPLNKECGQSATSLRLALFTRA